MVGSLYWQVGWFTMMTVSRQILWTMVHWKVNRFTVNRVFEVTFVRVVWQVLRTMVYRQVGGSTVNGVFYIRSVMLQLVRCR
jgi:hypothetical protein